MKTLALAVLFSFLTAAFVSSYSSSANAARAGAMSGHDNTYGSQKGAKCSAGACATSKKKK